MGPIKALAAIISHFGPKWFKAIANEAEHAPATIAGLLFVWLTIAGLGAWGVYQFTAHAAAAELRDATLTSVVATMQTALATNTTALDCSRQDTAISRKDRSITTASRLLELAQDEAEQRAIRTQLTKLQRELSALETTYQAKCML